MKAQQIFYTLAAGLTLLLSACRENPTPEIELGQFMSVYMMGARTIPYLVPLKTSENTALAYGITYGGTTNFNQGDIEAVVEPDLLLVEKYNRDNFTDYLPLPEGSYEFPSTKVVIRNGKNQSEPLAIEVSPQGKLDGDSRYLLPVTIRSIEGRMTFSEEFKTVYYLFEAQEPPAVIDKTKWTAAGWSTVWGDQANRGIESTFDNDPQTYWHSTPQNPLPQWYSIDMGSEVKIAGFTLTNRQDDAGGASWPKKLTFDVSLDGESWQTVLTIDEVPQTKEPQTFPLERRIKCRYFKFTIESNYSGQLWTFIAEGGVY